MALQSHVPYLIDLKVINLQSILKICLYISEYFILYFPLNKCSNRSMESVTSLSRNYDRPSNPQTDMRVHRDSYKLTRRDIYIYVLKEFPLWSSSNSSLPSSLLCCTPSQRHAFPLLHKWYIARPKYVFGAFSWERESSQNLKTFFAICQFYLLSL